MKVQVIYLDGKKVGERELSDELFAVDAERRDILDRVVQWQLACRRSGNQATRTISQLSGTTNNIAASTVRPPQSASHFDYDVTVGVSLPGAFGKTDFDNSGRVGIDATTFFYTAGGLVQFGPLGVGVLADFQRFTLSGADGGESGGGVVTVGRLHAATGYTVWDGQLSLGVGIRGLTTSIDTVQKNAGLPAKNAFTVVGLAPELGFLLRPDYQPFRIGATYRAPVQAGGGALEEAPDRAIRQRGETAFREELARVGLSEEIGSQDFYVSVKKAAEAFEQKYGAGTPEEAKGPALVP